MALLKLTLVSQSLRGHPYGGLREKGKEKKKKKARGVILLCSLCRTWFQLHAEADLWTGTQLAALTDF